LLESWASLKSFRRKNEDTPPPPDGPGNPTVNFHGESRRNDTHQSTTDPDAWLARKGPGREAKLSYAGRAYDSPDRPTVAMSRTVWRNGSRPAPNRASPGRLRSSRSKRPADRIVIPDAVGVERHSE
jgi:hypothetical protein